MNAATLSNKFDERELTITRVFDAPRALVFKVWTDPKHLAQWWGPQGFTNPVCEFDARAGGELRIHMRGPDCAIYPMKGVIREFAPPERLVFTSIAIDAAGDHLLEGVTTVLFDEENGKTKLTVHAEAVAVVELAKAYLQGMEMGWTQSIDKLEAYIARTA
jgi:uncharacterized protein YndB with AHSA1/START domain